MNLLILEYVSGGGYADQKLSSNILSEAYGMLRCLISDCKAAGHDVTTLLDYRLEKFNPPNKADKTVFVSNPKEVYMKLEELSGVVDAVYVIAPEQGQVLEKLVETVEASGGTSLNCGADAIRRASNKMNVYETVKKLGLKTPETVMLDIHEKTETIKRAIKESGYPLVFKPLDGVSCGGLSIVKDDRDIEGAVKKVVQESTSRQFIAQKWVKGKAVSACVFVSGEKALSVTLNRQLVALATPDEESEYYGGTVPFKHILEGEALKAAEKAVEGVAGLRGYVGVDMILTKDEPVIMEINPRLTVSYICLKRAVNFNPATAIIEAATRGTLPEKPQHRGYTYFSKVQVLSCPQIIAETYRMKEVVSPPFPVEENTGCALVAATSTTQEGAQSAFYRAKKRLLNLYSRGD